MRIEDDEAARELTAEPDIQNLGRPRVSEEANKEIPQSGSGKCGRLIS